MPQITYFPENVIHRWQEERRWSHVIKLPGVRASMQIPVVCRLLASNQKLITPRRLRITACIDLTSEEVHLQPTSGPKVRWKSLPSHIPCASAVVNINHISHIPREQPAIYTLENWHVNARILQVIALRDRLIVKGSLTIDIKYHS